MLCTIYNVWCPQKRNIYILEGIMNIVFNGKKSKKNENFTKRL